jgi:uncharacterized repeat protein (TIGR03803 family)
MPRNRSFATLKVVLLTTIIIGTAGAPYTWAQSKFKTLYKFTGGIDGMGPFAGVTFDRAGNLYGTTWMGGVNNSGTVFKLAHKSDGSWRESVLHSFCSVKSCGDGSRPSAGLIFDQRGNLYGATQEGGASGGGTVFKLTPSPDGSWSESVLYSFCSLQGCRDGQEPIAGLIFDQAGSLYGTTFTGGDASICDVSDCGTVFKLTPTPDGSWRESVLYSFCSLKGCRDGQEPIAGLIFDKAGSLYGTTLYGGSQCSRTGCGVVFQLTPNADGSWSESVLRTFSGINGYGGLFPYGGLIFNQTGDLYGTTEFGGKRQAGVVFQLTPNSDGRWKEEVLHGFSVSDGYAPIAGLIFDRAWNLYGTTFQGGRGGGGVVFKLTSNSKGGWVETVLHNFLDHPGALPDAGLTFDAAGNLYGTTYGDGSNGTFGSVFEITP